MAEDTKVSGQPEARVDFVALKPGHRVGRYEIVAVLGQGGFGITYRARDGQLGRDVALKEYLPTALAVRQDGTTVLPRSTDVADDFIWGRARFVAEGRTLATLHEAAAIVKVFDFLEANGTAYIVMELVRGETLEARASRGMPGPAEVDAILWPLLDGLEQVHEAGFLHRDIKPANILLGPSGRPTLIDFGASRAAIAGRTTAMTAIFTPGYAAAEQFTSARQGPWTDIYGLAATMYRLLSGMVPPSAFDRMLEDHYKPLTALALRNFSPRLLAGIDAGMAVRVDDRPPSIAKWRSLLIGAAPVPADDRTQVVVPVARESAPAPPSSVQVPTGSAAGPAPAKSRAPFYVGATVAAMLLLAAGGWFALAPRLGGIGVHDMKVEDLERVLAERRKADAEAADKRRLEEEAQKKASADADAKVAADAEVVRAQAERQKAEVELARLREQLEAERKATAERQELADAKARREAAEAEQRRRETEMAALKRAEEEARRKAEADAESKRRADEALAAAQAERARAEADARAKADEEARRKAEASARELAEAQVREKAAAETSAKADLEAKKAAEATETGLSLSQLDRQRVQVALTALGFNTNGSDGAFGPRTRQMIGAWQKARTYPVTGYLSGSQNQELLKAAAAAVAKVDAEQKKLEDETRRKAEEEKARAVAAPRAAVPTPPLPAAPSSAPAAGPFDGSYSGALIGSAATGGGISVSFTSNLRVSGGRLTGEIVERRCGSYSVTAMVANAGEIAGQIPFADDTQCSRGSGAISGRVREGVLDITIRSARITVTGSLRKTGN